MENNSGKEIRVFTGIVTFKKVNPGSKSEVKRPFLDLKNGNSLLLHYKDDNPFENATLVPFAGHRCTVSCKKKDYVSAVGSREYPRG